MDDKNGNSGEENMGIISKRYGNPTEKIYYYPEEVTDAEIDSGNYTDKMILLDKTEYSIYKDKGDFVLILSCNRKRVVINEKGQLVDAGNSSEAGLFTEFKGFMTLEITDEDLPLDWKTHGEHLYYKPIRQKLKFPQHASKGETFREPDGSTITEGYNRKWRAQYFTFSGGGIYSLSRFHGVVKNEGKDSKNEELLGGGWFAESDCINDLQSTSLELHAGEILTNNALYSGNTLYQMSGNTCRIYDKCGYLESFGANWLNMSVYLPQTGWVYDNYSYLPCGNGIHQCCSWRTNTQFTADPTSSFYTQDNSQSIIGCYTNTCSFARSDLNWTDFINLTKTDIFYLNSVCSKGIKTDTDGKTFNVTSGTISNMTSETYSIQGTYRNGIYIPNPRGYLSVSFNKWYKAAPINGGKCQGKPVCAADGRTYFFKGADTSDTVAYIVSLGIV